MGKTCWHAVGVLLRGLLAAAGLGLASAAAAAGLTVTPVSLQFQPRDTAHALWLNNSGEAPLHAQLRAYRWTQDGSRDLLQPTAELVLSPPIIELQPGEVQLVRVIRPAAAATAEQAYRILVDELPDPAKPVRSGLNFVMQFSVPVFAAAAVPGVPAAQLDWSLRQEGSELQLVSRNRGGRRAQITELELRDAQGRVQLAQPGLVGYALAGSGRRWVVDLPAEIAAGVTELQSRVDGQTVRQPLRLAGDRD